MYGNRFGRYLINYEVLLIMSAFLEGLWGVVEDGAFAAVAAVGFGAVSHPARRAFKWIALLGALGHAIRYICMHYLGLDIGFGSFAGALAIGFASIYAGSREHIPMTCLYIPALLPMIPGIYAYKTIFSLMLFMQALGDAAEGAPYMSAFFLNATVTVTVVFMLAVGATIPLFIFKKKAVSMTRKERYSRRKC